MKTIKSILQKTSISGFEDDLRGFLVKEFKNFGFEVNITPLGNICAFLKGKRNFTILFDAHYDQIGFVVQKINKNGTVYIKPLGGNDPRVLLGSLFIIAGKREVPAVIATVPPHLSEKSERENIPKIENMLLDTGLSFEELNNIITVGDPIYFKKNIVEMDGYVMGQGIDNRAGVYTLLELSKWLKENPMDNSILIRITVQEEVGIRGAQNETILPFNLGVIVDATFATQHLANDDRTFDITGGPTIMYGPNYSRYFTKKLEIIAREKNIPFQREIDESVRGTNSYAYRVMDGGKPLIGLSYPIYNMHTPAEIVSIETLKQLIELEKIITTFEET